MTRFAIIIGLISGFLFGIATPFSKILLTWLNSFQLAGLLYLGAAVAMLPYIFRKGNNLKLLFINGAGIKTAGIIFFGGFLGPVLLLVGLKTANAASVSIWLNMELVATAILGIIFFRDSLDKPAWIGVILTIIAGIVTSAGEGSAGITAGLLITAACICWAIDNHLTALVDGASPQTVTFVKGLVAGSVNFIIGCFLSSQPLTLIEISPAIVVGIFSYGISIVLYVISAQNLGATRCQILFSTAPLWGVILSYIFIKEPFQWVHVASILLLAMAVVITNVFKHSHAHNHDSMDHAHYHKHDDEHHNHEHYGESEQPGKGHSHFHQHESTKHHHHHYPDLHHRHIHGKG